MDVQYIYIYIYTYDDNLPNTQRRCPRFSKSIRFPSQIWPASLSSVNSSGNMPFLHVGFSEDDCFLNLNLIYIYIYMYIIYMYMYIMYIYIYNLYHIYIYISDHSGNFGRVIGFKFQPYILAEVNIFF